MIKIFLRTAMLLLSNLIGCDYIYLVVVSAESVRGKNCADNKRYFEIHYVYINEKRTRKKKGSFEFLENNYILLKYFDEKEENKFRSDKEEIIAIDSLMIGDVPDSVKVEIICPIDKKTVYDSGNIKKADGYCLVEPERIEDHYYVLDQNSKKKLKCK